MTQPRSIASSDVKASLGEILGSLAVDGPVEITRNGRPVALLTAASRPQEQGAPAKLAAMAPLYASGALTWRKVEDETGAAFGDLLVELGRQGLSLPRVAVPSRPGQVAKLDSILRHAGQSS